MDPFTQRMLEKAELRSRALGISNASKYPLMECNNDNGGGGDASVTPTAQWQQSKASAHQQQQQQHLYKHEKPLLTLGTAPPLQSLSHASTNTVSAPGNRPLQVVEKKTALDALTGGGTGGISPNKVMRQFSAVNKENVDLGIEINIMMDKDVEVEVHVEEQETTDGENESHGATEKMTSDVVVNQPLARIRDTSRNRLQRLGALYSKPDDLSSPIHRTEAKFCSEDTASAADMESAAKRPKQRFGKLAALASTINEWEDDTSVHHTPISIIPPPKPDLPSRRRAQQQNESAAAAAIAVSVVDQDTCKTHSIAKSSDPNDVIPSGTTKQLKWDPSVINSLEAQGFQRRESNTAKLAYEYSVQQPEEDGEEEENGEEENNEHEAAAAKIVSKQPATVGSKPVVGKLVPADIFSAAPAESKSQQQQQQHMDKKLMPAVKTGLVSGRAAVFEHRAAEALSQHQQQQQRPQKDPTELSLRERMQLFEKNKGNALLPKAALGMAPPLNKILPQDSATGRREIAKASPAVSSAPISNKASTLADATKVRDKVAALVANTTTISENQIKADINRQRQEDMQVLANRFNKQKDAFAKEQLEQQQKEMAHKVQANESSANKATTTTTSASVAAVKSAPTAHQGSGFRRPPPPPPPPLPKMANAAYSTKRPSPGNTIDESKRARKNNILSDESSSNNVATRLYPVLSDLESNESYNCGTTATPAQSECNTANEEDNNGTDDAKYRDVDISCHDSYMNSDDDDDDNSGLANNSLGREVLQAVQKKDIQHQHQQQQQQQQGTSKPTKEVRYADVDRYYGGDSSLNSSEASMGVDDYLVEEAFDEKNSDGDDDFTQESDEDEPNTSRISRESKGTAASNSFTFRKTPKRFSNCHTISEEVDDYQTPKSSKTFTTAQPVKSELSVNQEDDNMVTLVHTVSFYRKQQNANSNNSTPVRRICREQQILRTTSPNNVNLNLSLTPTQHETPNQKHNDEQLSSEHEHDESRSDLEAMDNAYKVQEKVKKLLDEVCKQQQVIAQTSQALNLCAATIEFSGSTESVEGERHLLVATHRRQACLDEVQRLRVEKSLRPVGAPREKGRLTVKEITLPLRQEYIRRLAADTISGHHLVCLLKYNEHVLATRTVPTLPGLLAVKFPDVLQLNNVYADFRITLEIYGMTAQREVLPHEVKYHINLNKKSGIKTPKKKGSDNRLIMPPVQSPAGPNVVRTPALVQYGFAIFSLRETQRTTWTLTQVLGVSPLEGSVHMKVNCELSVSVEHKGFLTMFEDISGFGAWHRRWCYLSGTMLNYWKYPDDEKRKTPMGSIDLYACTSQKISIAPRDICARLNTMLLECERPALDTDQESLIIVPHGRTTTVRYLLSADTKEEREEWCAYFNKALTLLRAWGPPQ